MIRDALEAYRGGRMGFSELAKLPDWRRLAMAAMRRQRAVRPDWIEPEDVVQEALLAVHTSVFSHETPGEAFSRLISEMTLAAWPDAPDLSFLNDAAYTDPKRSDLEKYVAAQIYWVVRNMIREASKIPHKRGARAPRELPVSSLVSRRRDGGEPEAIDDWFTRHRGGVNPEQEITLAKRRAIDALPDEVRAAVNELFESGSVERAVARFASGKRNAKVIVLDAARRVASEATL